MRIEHIAIWVQDLEKMRSFYLKYFPVASNEKYTNSSKHFSSYFLSFEQGARIELMHRTGIIDKGDQGQHYGLAHFAISLGSKDQVDELTERLRQDGHSIMGEPRITGDGYYESVIADPEGNLIELTV